METTTRAFRVEVKLRVLSFLGWLKEFLVDLMAETKARLLETLIAMLESQWFEVQLQRLEDIDNDIHFDDQSRTAQ